MNCRAPGILISDQCLDQYQAGIEQDVCKETNVTNGLLMSPSVSFPSSQCHKEKQRHVRKS